jgi:hypothetical protein
MADGAFISVQPNSEYVLDNYRYSGQPDGTEQAVYRLAKGGVRAVTGLIGRTNTEAYKVNTAVATIGIRGSACNPMCPTYIDGGFAGELVSGTPEFIGLEYDIQETDVIIGVAAFSASGGLIRSLVTKPMVFVAVEPSIDPPAINPDQVDVTLGNNGVLHFDAGTGKLIGAIISPKIIRPDPIS